jgi:uncharacterized protein YutE (UPF0331/DUF86 family)
VVDARLLTSKLAELAGRIDRIRGHARATADDLASDRDALEIVSFNLMLAVQSCVDVASHIVADEGWTPAGTLADAFARLAAHGVISEPVRRALARAVGLRNVVAHGYAGSDPAIVHVASTAGLRDLEAFSAEVAAWLNGRP